MCAELSDVSSIEERNIRSVPDFKVRTLTVVVIGDKIWSSRSSLARGVVGAKFESR